MRFRAHQFHLDRVRDELDDCIAEQEADQEPDDEAQDGPDQTGPKLFEVVSKRHPRAGKDRFRIREFIDTVHRFTFNSRALLVYRQPSIDECPGTTKVQHRLTRSQRRRWAPGAVAAGSGLNDPSIEG